MQQLRATESHNARVAKIRQYVSEFYYEKPNQMNNARPKRWRGGATSVALWALLTTAATLELYDEVPLEVNPPIFQDENFIDNRGASKYESAEVNKNGGPYLALAKDVLLYRLIQSLQKDPLHASTHRSDWQPEKYEPHHHNVIRSISASEDFSKDAMVKRLTHAFRGERSLSFRSLDQMYSYRPQQKWKIKKGKSLGSQMVCYFKLCAFRSPV
ncbi:hypothetical protein O0L34_g5796 [Tuta absoluta]|nr:hypothetical protein O0L34_g5796 [Tuta absoluta]